MIIQASRYILKAIPTIKMFNFSTLTQKISIQMVSKQNIIIRNATKDQIKTYLPEWQDREGWDFPLNQPQYIYEAGPQGFFLCLNGNEPIGHAAVFNIGNQYGVFGMFLLKPEYRNKGIGVKLFDHTIKYLTSIGVKNITLNAVIEQTNFYQKRGFILTNQQTSMYEIQGIQKYQTDPRVVPLTSVDFNLIREYEKSVGFVYPENFTRKWISQPGHSLAYVQEGVLKGMGVIRPTKQVYRLGPLLADSYEVGQKLFQSFRKILGPSRIICITANQSYKHSLSLVQKFNCRRTVNDIKMFSKQVPTHFKTDKIIGMYDFSLC